MLRHCPFAVAFPAHTDQRDRKLLAKKGPKSLLCPGRLALDNSLATDWTVRSRSLLQPQQAPSSEVPSSQGASLAPADRCA